MILCVLPGEEDGVGAEQNQDSGNLASPPGLAADMVSKSDSILSSPPHPAASVSHLYKERGLPSLQGMVGFLLQLLKCSILSCLMLRGVRSSGC